MYGPVAGFLRGAQCPAAEPLPGFQQNRRSHGYPGLLCHPDQAFARAAHQGEQAHPVFGIIQLIAAERRSNLLRLLQNMFYDLILLYGKTLERIQKHPISRKIILPLQDRIQAC